MQIDGKVHLMFEQSGTFKKEFKKLGYEAFDYDIQDHFHETDHVVDLFKAIEDAYDGKPSLFDDILQRSANRELFFSRAVKMLAVAKIRGLRIIMENPWSEQTFLKQNFPFNPSVVDMNRTLRGDYYVKPTAYWFINCEPTNGQTLQPRKPGKPICQVAPNGMPGICNEERSLIHPDYARNFICDFILGKQQNFGQLSLF